MARTLATNRQLATVRTLAANRVVSPYRAIVGSYFERVKATRPSSLIGYWPLDETSGATAIDYSGATDRNGTNSGATVAQVGIGDGRTCYTFDGVNDYINIFTPSLQSVFNGAIGMFEIWVQYAGSWTDGVARRFVSLRSDASNRILIGKAAGSNQLQAQHIAGGTTVTITKTSFNPTAWVHVVLIWDRPNNLLQLLTRIQGQSPQRVTATGLGTWVGSLTSTVTTIGAGDTAGNNPWHGGIQHPALWSDALTTAEGTRLDYAI